MKPFLLSCCFFVFIPTLTAQNKIIQSFIGHWEGTLQWFQTGKKDPQVVKMQLIIRPTDSADVYTWQIIYGSKGEDNRPYLLKPVDTAKGHWQIDEQNGIVLDQYLIGNRITSAFTVQSNTILNSYWRQDNNLVAEFYSMTAKPVATTGAGTDESPRVDSYGTRSYQRALLKPLQSASSSRKRK